MSADFNPYYKWLSIPLDEQPANHYRLLGVALFEPDADVIEAAADRQMAHVQRYKSGPQSTISQDLLNQLAAAKVCLLVADKRAAYDQSLKAALAAKSPAKPVDAHAAPPETERPVPLNTTPRMRHPVLVVSGVAAGVAMLILAVIFWEVGRKQQVATNTKDANSPTTPTETEPSPESPTLATPVQPAPTAPVQPIAQPAVVEVAGMESRPFPLPRDQWPSGFPDGALEFSFKDKPKAVSTKFGRLDVHVKESGTLYLVAKWEYQGNDGSWSAERQSKEQLVASGWVDLGPCTPWDSSRTLFRRECQAGEELKIRVNKYWPPLLIVGSRPRTTGDL